MPYIPNQQENQGLYVPTTVLYDIAQQISDIKDISPELRQLLVKLYQSINSISIALNMKSTGIYSLGGEFVNGKIFYNNNPDRMNDPRSNFSIVFDIEPLNVGVTTIAHGLPITAAWRFTDMWGAANDPTGGNYYPIGAGGNTTIEVNFTTTDLVITNNSGINFAQATVVGEFCKQP